MKNLNNFLFFVGSIIVVAIIVIVFKYLMDTTGIVNQGNFRINDFAIKSTVSVDDQVLANETEASTLSDISLNISQKNDITILVAKAEGIEASQITLDNITIEGLNKKGQIYIYQKDKEKVDLTESSSVLNIEKVEQDGQYLIELKLDNDNFLTSAKINSGVESVVYDGTILNSLNVDIKDLMFVLNFNINIIDNTGKKNVCKVSLNIPGEDLSKNGIVLKREYTGNFNFVVE